MQWKRYAPYLLDRPSQPWTYFKSLDKKPLGEFINKTIKAHKKKSKHSTKRENK